jgi:hypothetical protein
MDRRTVAFVRFGSLVLFAAVVAVACWQITADAKADGTHWA